MTRLTPPGEPPGTPQEQIVIDHVLWRRAPLWSCLAGVAAALALFVFAQVPWWLPLLAFFVIAAVTFRLLRPRARVPGWEDEL